MSPPTHSDRSTWFMHTLNAFDSGIYISAMRHAECTDWPWNCSNVMIVYHVSMLTFYGPISLYIVDYLLPVLDLGPT